MTGFASGHVGVRQQLRLSSPVKFVKRAVADYKLVTPCKGPAYRTSSFYERSSVVLRQSKWHTLGELSALLIRILPAVCRTEIET